MCVFIFLNNFYVHWCFAYMYVCEGGPLELKFQMVVSCLVGAGN